MITTYSTIIWLSAALTGVFSLLIYLGSHKPSTKFFSLTAFWAFVWTIGMSGYFTASTYEWILFWGKWNHFSSSILAAAFFYFCLVFPKEKLPPKWVTVTIVTIETILIYLHMLTNLIIKEYHPTGARIVDRGIYFGDWGFLFHLFFVGFFVGGFIVLIKNFLKETDPATKSQIKFLMFGVFAGVVPIAIINLVLGTLGNFYYYWMGAPLTLAWVSISGYVIVKHKALTVRLFVAELAVVAMALVLFSNIFFAEIFKLGLSGRAVIFLVFAIFGYFFIKSVTDGENQREWLSILSLELKDFNQNLEARVIAETKEAERERSHIETVADTITSGLIEYGRDMTVQRVNRTAERLLGIDRKNIIGSRIEPENEGGKWGSLASIIYPNAKECDVCDVAVDRPVKRELQVTTVPILDGYFKMFRDVTREKIIAKSKSEFISIIAHNFKEPLSTVRTTLDMLLRGEKGELQGEQPKIIKNMHEVNARTISLVDDLFDVAKIEEGHFDYKFKVGNIIEVAEKVAEEYKPQAETRGISFRFVKDAVSQFSFDEHKMRLVVKNIIDNAIYYTKEGGIVELKVKKDGEFIIISAKDNGIGIPEDQHDRIFSKLFRAPNALKIRPDGSGLGLFIAKSIVESHKGTIELKTEENKGTEVIIKLPIKK